MIKWTPKEDRLLKRYIGTKTAEELSVIIGRPRNGIYHRTKALGLNGQMIGENHWNAKLSNTQCQMAIILHDAGFSVNQINDAAFNHVSIAAITDLISARTRKQQ